MLIVTTFWQRFLWLRQGQENELMWSGLQPWELILIGMYDFEMWNLMAVCIFEGSRSLESGELVIYPWKGIWKQVVGYTRLLVEFLFDHRMKWMNEKICVGAVDMLVYLQDQTDASSTGHMCNRIENGLHVCHHLSGVQCYQSCIYLYFLL